MLTERDERYVRFLGRYFFASGHDREDIEQTARLGFLLGGRVAARRRVLDLVTVSRRRAFSTLPEGLEPRYDPTDHLEARETLRSVLAAATTPKQKIAVGRLLRGEDISPKWVDNALYAVRKKSRS